MKKSMILLLFAIFLFSSPTIDGIFEPSEGWIFIGENSGYQTTTIGADLESLFITASNDTLFLFITTQNQGSWDLSYGIAFDFDFNQDSGFGRSDFGDVWGRKMAFGMDIDPSFKVDYMVYLWWDGGSGSITSWYKYKWDNVNNQWIDIGFPQEDRAYTGNSSTGLQTLEIALPSPVSPPPDSLRFVLFIAGGGGSSAVDILPQNSSVVFPATNDEWIDEDTVSVAYVLRFTGIKENEKDFIHYENGILIVQNKGDFDISIYNILGEKIFEKRNLYGRKEIPLSLKNGVYFVRINGRNVKDFRKIIVTK